MEDIVKEVATLQKAQKKEVAALKKAQEIIAKKLLLLEQLGLGGFTQPIVVKYDSAEATQAPLVNFYEAVNYLTDGNISRRLCYDILELYYKPLNENIEGILRSETFNDKLEERKQQLLLDAPDSQVDPASHSYHIKLIKALTIAEKMIGKEINIPFPITEIQNLYDIIDYLVVDRGDTNLPILSLYQMSKGQREQGDDEKKEMEEDSSDLTVKDMIEQHYYLTSLKNDVAIIVPLKVFLAEKTALKNGIEQNEEQKGDDAAELSTQGQLLNNRLSLLLRTVHDHKQEITTFISDKSTLIGKSQIILNWCLAHVKLIEAAVFNLEHFDVDELNTINSLCQAGHASDENKEETARLCIAEVPAFKDFLIKYGPYKYLNYYAPYKYLNNYGYQPKLADAEPGIFEKLAEGVRGFFAKFSNQEEADTAAPQNVGDEKEPYIPSALFKTAFEIKPVMDLNATRVNVDSLMALFMAIAYNREI